VTVGSIAQIVMSTVASLQSAGHGREMSCLLEGPRKSPGPLVLFIMPHQPFEYLLTSRDEAPLCSVGSNLALLQAVAVHGSAIAFSCETQAGCSASKSVASPTYCCNPHPSETCAPEPREKPAVAIAVVETTTSAAAAGASSHWMGLGYAQSIRL
jgi:hypothetical protein